MMGFGNLTFAGGRDTIIHSISSILAYFGHHPEGLEYLRQDPKRIVHASEEFFRAFMPLTHIGRVCPVPTNVMGVPVPAVPLPHANPTEPDAFWRPAWRRLRRALGAEHTLPDD
jgi:cytochrome P450